MKESSQDEKRRGSSNKAGWSLGWVSALDHEGRTIFVADRASRGKRFVAREDEKLTAFVELVAATRALSR